MTEIYKGNGLSIQVYFGSIVTGAGAGVYFASVPLSRPGKVLSAVASYTGEGADMDNVRGLAVNDSGSAGITYGEELSTVRVTLSQTDAVARTLTFMAIVFVSI